MKLLFICNFNQIRSVTAANIFKGKHETKSAGIYRNTVTQELVDWSDIIFVMDKDMENFLHENLNIKNKKIINLNIPSNYNVMQPELIKILKQKVNV